MNISPDLLYIYAAFYIYMLNKLGDKLSTELKKQCNALIKLLGELDDTWKIKGKKNEKKKEKDFDEEIYCALHRYLDVESNIYSNMKQESCEDNKESKEFVKTLFTNEEFKQFNLNSKYVGIKNKIEEIKC